MNFEGNCKFADTSEMIRTFSKMSCWALLNQVEMFWSGITAVYPKRGRPVHPRYLVFKKPGSSYVIPGIGALTIGRGTSLTPPLFRPQVTCLND